MQFEDFSKTLLSKIVDPSATIQYGHIGTEYQSVLCIKDGKIVEIGSFLYRIFREGLYGSMENLERFGLECEDYRLGFRTTPPTWCYKGDGVLTF